MGRTKSLLAMAIMMGMLSVDNKMFGLPRSMKFLRINRKIPEGMKLYRFSDGDKVIAKNYKEANEIHKMNKKR